MARPLSLALILVLGCTKPPPPAPSDKAPATISSATSRSFDAGDAAPATVPFVVAKDPDDAGPAHAEPDPLEEPATTPDGCPSYARSLADARRATVDKRYDDAIAAYAEAIKAKPFSAIAWAETGYAELLAGTDPRDSLAIGRSLTKDKAILAAAWWNEADADARDGRADDARLHLALAASFGNGAAKKKLGAGSTCTATWSKKVEPIPFVKGWTGVLSAMREPVMCDGARSAPAGATEAAAKKAACQDCNGGGEKLTPAKCDGAGPWMIRNGYQMCHSFNEHVLPFPNGRFVVDSVDDAFPGIAYATTPYGFSAVIVGDVTPHEETRVPWETMANGKAEDGCAVDVSAEVPLETPQHCMAGEAYAPTRGPTHVVLWDKDGKGILDVAAWGDVPTVDVDAAGKTAHLTGAGCDEMIPL